VTNLTRESTVGKTPITRLRLRKPLLVVPTQRKNKFLAEMHTGIDLFLTEPEDRRKKLHLSAALGEAEWTEGLWPDLQWGKNALWTANSIALISENGERKVVPLESFEFQISRSLEDPPQDSLSGRR
jgi:hypothetical protein